jgi:hypothetical protein
LKFSQGIGHSVNQLALALDSAIVAQPSSPDPTTALVRTPAGPRDAALIALHLASTARTDRER